MKRRTIIILIASMLLSFIALIFIQVRYVSVMSEMIEQQFDDAVKRSLMRTVILVEQNEALEYLAQTLDQVNYPITKNTKISYEDEKLVEGADSMGVSKDTCKGALKNPQIRISTHHGKATIEETSKLLQDKFRQEFSRSKTILDQAVFRWLGESSKKNIRDRVDFVDLSHILENYLTSNGVDLPFYYRVVDKYEREIFRCSKNFELDNTFKQDKRDVYKQKFFPMEDSAQEAYLEVTFPTRQDYIFKSLFLFYPSVVIVFLILAIFIVAVIVIFKQKQLNNIKNDFVNNMTHELKTPIASISLASQMLQDTGVGKTPEKVQQISKVIKDETLRLSRMVEEVLKLSLFETEKSTIKMRELHVNELIQHTFEIFSLKVANKEGKITTILNASNDLILADEVHITNVIHNLVDNALKYSDKALLLTLETWNDKEKDQIYISIEDNGIGIAKDDQKRVFEKFYRVPTGNQHNVKGFGLGLAYVKKIIQEHHGSIKIESEPHIGTKFIINLPTLKTK